MNEKRMFILANSTVRARAAAFIEREAPDGYHVTIQPPIKKRAQEEKYHAMIGDIAKQTTYAGQRWDFGDMKRILVDEFAEEMRDAGEPLHQSGRLIPSENGRRVIQLGVQTRHFWVKEASAFIEFLFAYGAMREVQWSDEARGVRVAA